MFDDAPPVGVEPGAGTLLGAGAGAGFPHLGAPVHRTRQRLGHQAKLFLGGACRGRDSPAARRPVVEQARAPVEDVDERRRPVGLGAPDGGVAPAFLVVAHAELRAGLLHRRRRRPAPGTQRSGDRAIRAHPRSAPATLR